MIFSSWIGLVHLVASVLALIFGTWILITTKGTTIHRKIGYLYAFSMLVLIITAFMIYRLFGTFGIFHIAATVSTITLAGGMLPVILRKPRNSWLGFHFSFMYWSVMGLYAAFVAEVLVRIPKTPFFRMVGLGTAFVMILAYIFFFIYKKKWQKLSAVYTENS